MRLACQLSGRVGVVNVDAADGVVEDVNFLGHPGRVPVLAGVRVGEAVGAGAGAGIDGAGSGAFFPPSSTAMVSGPGTPSASSPFAACHSFTAAHVPVPNFPSG